MRIEDMPINTVQDMLDALQKVEDTTVPLLIWDDGDLREISLVDASITNASGKPVEVHINVGN